MLGFIWLTPLFLMGVLGIMYFLDRFHLLEQIPLANMVSGKVQQTPLNTVIAIVLVVFGFGYIGVDTATDLYPSASASGIVGADIVLILNDGSGTDFADTGYSFYALDYSTYAGSNSNDILTEIKDYGTAGLVGAGGGIAVAETVSDGKATFDDYLGTIGDNIIIFGYDDTVPAAGDYETLMETIEILSYNENLGSFGISPNRFTLNTFGSIDSYNFAGTDITGYEEDEDAAKVGMSINFDIYSNANYNISKDAGLYVEIPTEMQSQINKIKVSTTDGVFGEFSSFLDTSNMDTTNPVFESAPAKQSSSNNMYYVGMLPDSYRTSTTNLDKVNVDVSYDHLGTGSYVSYLYVVEQVNAGSGLHFDIAANPAFALNTTAVGIDGWQS